MSNLPKDPVMLLSVVNTVLRDTKQDLDEFCKINNVEKEDIIATLKTIEYEYNEEQNKFV